MSVDGPTETSRPSLTNLGFQAESGRGSADSQGDGHDLQTDFS